ncbi:hypothetical protein FACS189450_10130 [Spirochaetia bacterium]|nr:hypothetical protein FACS189450_10130 [Spirochaetia bacterium]
MSIISIIVPVYKVEKYLRRCLDSIIEQTFIGFECILVDDGSPDGCPAICDEYAKKDSRFVVIHQANTGVSAARNAGLDIARGDWIWFVDSDDWLEPNALETLYAKQQETGADIVIGGSYWHFNHRTVTKMPKIDAGKDILVNFFIYDYGHLWDKLYKKNLFDNYQVPEYTIGEDAIVNANIFANVNSNKVQIVYSVIYNYDRKTNGVVRGIENNSYKSYQEHPYLIFRLAIEKIVEKIDDKNITAGFSKYMLDGIIRYLRVSKNITREEILFFYEKYYRNNRYKNMLKIHNRIVLPLFHISMMLGNIYIFCLKNIIKN